MTVRLTGAAAVAATGLALAACARGALRLDALPSVFSVGALDRYGSDSLAVEPGGEVVTFSVAQDAEIAMVAVAPSGEVRPLYPFAPGESSRFTAGSHTIVVPVSYEWAPDPNAPARPTAALEVEAMVAYRRCLAERRPRPPRPQPAPRAPGDTSTRQVTPSPPEGSMFTTDVEACGSPPLGTGATAAGPGRWRPRNDVIVLVASRTPLTAERLRQRLLGLRVRSPEDLRELPRWITGDHLRPPAGYYSVRFPGPRQQER